MTEQARVSLLFVCTGNTCRSPMAEAICKKMLADRLHCLPEELTSHGIHVASAGIAAGYGYAASPEAVDILAVEGIDLTTHQSQPLTQSLLDQSHRIYTLTNQHRRVVLAHQPDLQSRVALLGLEDRDIPDPIGGDHTVYTECKQIIHASLVPIVDEVIANLESP